MICQRKGCANELTGRRIKYCCKTCAEIVHHEQMRASAKALYTPKEREHRLTPEIVKTIRERWKSTDDTYAAMAQDYHIHPTTVHKIVSGKRWRHV